MAQWTIAPAPTIALCDALVTFIRQQWEPKAPARVERAHVNQAVYPDGTRGRLVSVVPIGYDSVAAARGLDFYTHQIDVWVHELYEDAQDPEEGIPIEWHDERVHFAHTLRDALDFYRDGTQPSFNKFLQTMRAPVEEVYDAESIDLKLFRCVIRFEFQEQETI